MNELIISQIQRELDTVILMGKIRTLMDTIYNFNSTEFKSLFTKFLDNGGMDLVINNIKNNKSIKTAICLEYVCYIIITKKYSSILLEQDILTIMFDRVKSEPINEHNLDNFVNMCIAFLEMSETCDLTMEQNGCYGWLIEHGVRDEILIDKSTKYAKLVNLLKN